MKIIVTGGDGFCGWPTSLHLSNVGHDVLIIDNQSRRLIADTLKYDSLAKIHTLEKRLDKWHELTGHRISFQNLGLHCAPGSSAFSPVFHDVGRSR